jgi:hypothetical protein
MPDIFLANDNKPLEVSASESTPPFIPAMDEEVIKKDGPMHIFSAFHRNPEHLTVVNQEKNEKILLFLRKSHITNVKWVIGSLIMLLIPIFLSPFINPLSSPFGFPFRYILFFTAFYYLLVFTYIYVSFITWYFNISLVTNIRVIDIDFSNLIYKNIAATKNDIGTDVNFGALTHGIFNFLSKKHGGHIVIIHREKQDD